MEEKYYTPDISEFFVGFECEFKNKLQLNEWASEICNSDLINIALSSYEEQDYDFQFVDMFRVKYLDKSDVEGLGFVEIGQECYYYKGDINGWCLEKLYDDKIKSYYRINDALGGTRVFLEIKNKSELIKLIKQIDIS